MSNDIDLDRRGYRRCRRYPVLHQRAAVRILAAHPPDPRRRARPRSGFSLESPEGVRFLIRSRLFTDEEVDLLARQGPPPRGEAAFAHYPN